MQNTKQTFPGYKEKLLAKQQKKQEKQKKAEEKWKNSLPPFLMVRSGVFNIPTIVALICVPIAIRTGQVNCHDTFTSSLSAFIQFGCYLLPIIFFILAYEDAYSQKEIITSNVDRYIDGAASYMLDISWYKNKLLAKNIIKGKAERNTKLFERFIQRPTSVNDAKTANAIISGHLKTHPEDVKRVIDTFETGTMPKLLQRKINRLSKKHL